VHASVDLSEYSPGPQAEHVVPLSDARVSVTDPAAHTVHGSVEVAEYCPAAQGEHLIVELEVNCPASQAVHDIEPTPIKQPSSKLHGPPSSFGQVIEEMHDSTTSSEGGM
tara:strand:- start:596 stop:925 length:330 start_codon:yes stop_codon:yes gene_type:complete